MRKPGAEKDTRTDMTNAETNTAATVGERGAHVAPEKASSKEGGRPEEGCAQGPESRQEWQSQARPEGAKPARAKELTMPRPDSKGAKILALIRRPKGATLAELAKLTGWQNHSIRGFLSAVVGKKMGLTVESAKREDGERVYSISK
jgi:hypothetical protein